MDDKPDFGSTTAVRRYAPGLAWLPRIVRDKLTPAALWSAIAALAIAIGYVLNAQHEIHRANEDIERLNDSVTELQKERELLHKIDTQLAVMANQISSIASEVDRQREWRERIEDVAQSPPHARRRR